MSASFLFEIVKMLPKSSTIILTSTPFFTFCFSILKTESKKKPSEIIKYSIKINFSADFKSFKYSSKLSSPEEKYLVLVLKKIGLPVTLFIYLACL